LLQLFHRRCEESFCQIGRFALFGVVTQPGLAGIRRQDDDAFAAVAHRTGRIGDHAFVGEA